MPESKSSSSVSPCLCSEKPIRARLLRRLHACGRSLGFDHERLREQMRTRWPSKDSLTDLTTDQLRTFAMFLDALRPPGRRVKRSRPRGRPVDDEVIRLATPRQREFLTRLLHRAYGMLPDPAPVAFLAVANRLGNTLPIAAPPDRIEEVAAAIATDRDMRTAINATIVELKRRGLWTVRRPAAGYSAKGERARESRADPPSRGEIPRSEPRPEGRGA